MYLGVVRQMMKFLWCQFNPFVHKSTKQYGYSFAYDPLKVWNELPDDICSATSLLSFTQKLKACLFTKAYTPFVHCILQIVYMWCGLPLLHLWTMNFWAFCFLFVVP